MEKCLHKWICLLLTAAVLLSCASCGLRVSANELSKDYERKTNETGEITDAFKTAMADFSLSLFKRLVTEDEKNDLVSPLSAILCLAMIANGADGETKAQMETAFGMDVDALNRSLYAFTSSLYRADDCKLGIADSIWFRDSDDLHVKEDFLQTNADWYDAQVFAAPFDNSTVKDINNWCKHYTDGMIDKIIEKIDTGTLMYLINALVFDAKWSDPYEKSDVRDDVFHNYDGSQKTVQMLSSREPVYLAADGVIGFAKNYAGDRYSFVGLLPDEKLDVYDFIASLDGAAWTNLWNTRKRASVVVRMPEFTYSANMNLNETLQAMGMTDIFSGCADFSKLAKEDLCVSEVCQKTFIQVDRNGTKAAAITWGNMKATSAGPEKELRVILDRPFAYAIVDNATGLPLFLGAVSNL